MEASNPLSTGAAPLSGPTPQQAQAFSQPLLKWFRSQQRDLPWRRAPDPYAVWVSEIMLQQTQVATVIPYFELWMARFPTVEALSKASEAEVLHAWQGLGYYSRARNLLRGARMVMDRHDGQVPDTVMQLLELPGVGPYTAGAIASIAYNVSAPIVDGNVIRVLSRWFALRGDPARAPLRGRLWELAASLIPDGQARDFNPAMMELGATICTPTNPGCAGCPIAANCEARRLHLPEAFPETAARPRATPIHMVAGLVWRRGRVLLTQRGPDESRWPGMWQFPNTEVAQGEAPDAAVSRAIRDAVGIQARPEMRIALVRHSVTRYRITLEAFQCAADQGEPTARGCRAWNWVAPAQFTEYALPAAHRTIARRLLQGEGQLELGFSG